MQQLLISDANILIDIEEGGLIKYLFCLPYQFMIPDILFYEELDEQHKYLLDDGLKLAGLSEETMRYAEEVTTKYRDPSRNDCFALALAQQEKCSLLTGDKNLRKAAEAEGVIVMGTIWIVDRMVSNQLITIEQAEEAYQCMQKARRRLPWEKAFASLKDLKNEFS